MSRVFQPRKERIEVQGNMRGLKGCECHGGELDIINNCFSSSVKELKSR